MKKKRNRVTNEVQPYKYHAFLLDGWVRNRCQGIPNWHKFTEHHAVCCAYRIAEPFITAKNPPTLKDANEFWAMCYDYNENKRLKNELVKSLKEKGLRIPDTPAEKLAAIVNDVLEALSTRAPRESNVQPSLNLEEE